MFLINSKIANKASGIHTKAEVYILATPSQKRDSLPLIDSVANLSVSMRPCNSVIHIPIK